MDGTILSQFKPNLQTSVNVRAGLLECACTRVVITDSMYIHMCIHVHVHFICACIFMQMTYMYKYTVHVYVYMYMFVQLLRQGKARQLRIMYIYMYIMYMYMYIMYIYSTCTSVCMYTVPPRTSTVAASHYNHAGTLWPRECTCTVHVHVHAYTGPHGRCHSQPLYIMLFPVCLFSSFIFI